MTHTQCESHQAVLTKGLGRAEARGPSKEGARDWLLGILTSVPIAKATTPPIYYLCYLVELFRKFHASPFEIEV